LGGGPVPASARQEAVESGLLLPSTPPLSFISLSLSLSEVRMRLFLCSMVCVAMLALVGCKNDGSGTKSSNPQMMSNDACSHCPGVQTMTTDGKCPSCGMKVDKNAQMMSTDGCPKCPGVQTLSADGKCSMCQKS
jgi:hypothetical protein